MFILKNAYSLSLSSIRKVQEAELTGLGDICLQESWEGGVQEAAGSGQHGRWEASVVPQEVIDKCEGHWVTGRTSHNTDSQ